MHILSPFPLIQQFNPPKSGKSFKLHTWKEMNDKDKLCIVPIEWERERESSLDDKNGLQFRMLKNLVKRVSCLSPERKHNILEANKYVATLRNVFITRSVFSRIMQNLLENLKNSIIFLSFAFGFI